MNERRRYALIDAGDGPKRVLVRQHNGVDGFEAVTTEACSGCFEPGECMGLAHHYGYDNKVECHVGAGCSECGYTGKRRQRFWCPLAGFAIDPPDSAAHRGAA
jgi:hypothetical protein